MLEIKGKMNTAICYAKVVPNIVGVDIGCGMYTIDLGTLGGGNHLKPIYNFKAN